MFWKRLPVTHAIALWTLVGLAAAGLIAFLIYASMLSDARKTPVSSQSIGTTMPSRPPTLFGTVTAVGGGVLKIDSKQPYDEVLIVKETSITTVGGASASADTFKAGDVITATGEDIGDHRLQAAAIVILEKR